jgi:hypothetical protein
LEVGTDVVAGTYRLRAPAASCYWARLAGFSGALEDIRANDNVFDAYAIVNILAKDAGFESRGCGTWSTDLSPIQPDRGSITVDGTYFVKTDILPGKWRSTGGDLCYWARLKGFSGELKDIVANDNVFGGKTVVTIASSDVGFATKGCGTWTRG